MRNLPDLQFLELIFYKVNLDRTDVATLTAAVKQSTRLSVLRLNIARSGHQLRTR